MRGVGNEDEDETQVKESANQKEGQNVNKLSKDKNEALLDNEMELQALQAALEAKDIDNEALQAEIKAMAAELEAKDA